MCGCTRMLSVGNSSEDAKSLIDEACCSILSDRIVGGEDIIIRDLEECKNSRYAPYFCGFFERILNTFLALFSNEKKFIVFLNYKLVVVN